MADLFDTQTTDKEAEQPTQEANAPAEGSTGDKPVVFKVGDREYNPESATKKITEADKFIETLLQEKRSLEEQFEEVKRKAEGQSKLDELLELTRKQQLPSTEQPSEETPTVDQSEMMEQLRKFAEETYETKSQQEQRERNAQQALAAAKERYGDSYADNLREKGKQLGMTEAEIQELAGSKPNVFQELFVPKSANGKPAPGTAVNSAAVADSQPKERPYIGRHFNAQTRVDALRDAEKYYMEHPELLQQ